MKKMNLKKGFTLIELLVVVAIIGLLASIVMASLNNARSKGNDAAIKATLANMRAQAALYYDTNSSYGTGVTCSVTSAGTATGCTGLFADATLLSGLKSAASASGATLYAATDSTNGSNYAIQATLKQASVAPNPVCSAGSCSWCVDSSGQSKLETAAASATAVSTGACN